MKSGAYANPIRRIPNRPCQLLVSPRDLNSLPVEAEMSWSGDFSASTLADVVRWQTENTALSKRLRFDKKAAVNNRLAKQISHDEYQSMTVMSDSRLAECKRRRQIIIDELIRRQAGNTR
jgi:hypothetical protein